ncbi:MAG: 4Fe-4S binding protein [Phycisphaerae bacterium]
MLGQEAANVRADRCCGCGACVDACPNDAMRLI